MPTNIDTIIQKATAIFSDATVWFNGNIGHGFLSFIKSILSLISSILEFFIQVIQWVVNHI